MMNLLMISGDRSILQGKKGAFWYTLEELRKHWERVDVICPAAKELGNREQGTGIGEQGTGTREQELGNREEGIIQFPVPSSQLPFPNVFLHPSPRSLWHQSRWITKKGRELIATHHHAVMTVHEYPPFYNGRGAIRLSRAMHIPFMLEIHHIVGYPHPSSFAEAIGLLWSRFRLPREARAANAVRVVSNETEWRLCHWGIPQEKIRNLPSAYLDFDALHPDPSVPKRYDCVSCARFVGNKGLEEMLRAVAALPGVTLLLVGDGPLRPKLERLARDLGIMNRVTFTGWLPAKEDVYRALQSARIFLMNSRSEGGPRVTLEAMALGIPVISTEVGIIRQMNPGQTKCALLTSGMPDDLSRMIAKLLRDEPLQKKMSAGIMELLHHLFDRKTVIAAYARALQDLASTPLQ